MPDLISRQAAVDAICRACQYDKDDYTDCDDRAPSSTFCDYMNALRHLPSAQPEIVRCKNCKWYKTNYSWNGKAHKVCVIEPYEPIRKSDDFCSRAERRTDE